MNNSSCPLSDCCNLLQSVMVPPSPLPPKLVPRDQMGAVVYTICMLSLFSSLIFLLMFRAIRPREDEQVTSVLVAMRVRVDRDEKRRKRKQLREAKNTAQKWLTQIASRRLSFRRTNSDVVESIRSLPLRTQNRPASRAASYQGYLPEIVVTGESHPQRRKTPTLSRQASLLSDEELACETVIP